MLNLSSLIQPDRMLLVNWAAQLVRSASDTPLLPAEFVACQGRKVRLIDVRSLCEMTGPLGYIPGCDWVPLEQAMQLAEQLDVNCPTVFVSSTNERSGQIARAMEVRGMSHVAALVGGMTSWNNMGFTASRDPSIAGRQGKLALVLPAVSDVWPALDLHAIQAHIGDALSLRWIKLAAFLLHARLSCVDGRDDRGVIGTPGGDAGEFLLALAALEDVTDARLSPREVMRLLRKRLDMFGRLYMHSDVSALQKLVQSVRVDPRLAACIPQTKDALLWRAFFASPPSHAREHLLEHVVRPEHMGCGHLRLMMQHPERYGVRAALSQTFAESFHRLRWEGAFKAEFETLAGGHEEGAVVNVLVAGELHPFSLIPLVSPSCFGGQLFVNHPQVSSYLRHQLVHFLAQECAAPHALSRCQTQDMHARIEALASMQLTHTLKELAAGLPVYNVQFDSAGSFVVSEAGYVPGAK